MQRCLISATSALGQHLMQALVWEGTPQLKNWFLERWDLGKLPAQLKCGKFIEVDLPADFGHRFKN